jgi:hypothetical protein
MVTGRHRSSHPVLPRKGCQEPFVRSTLKGRSGKAFLTPFSVACCLLSVVLSPAYGLQPSEPQGPTPDARRLMPDQWVPLNEPSAGVQMLGWDEIRYAPDLGGVLFFGAYRSFTSENQNAIFLYRFAENRWRLLDCDAFFHQSEMKSDAGHTTGKMTYDEARRVIVYGGLVSMGRNDRLRTWVFDPWAQVGWDARPSAPVPGIPFDAASVYVPDLKATFRFAAGGGAWLYDAAANRWTRLAASGGPTFQCADAVYDARRKRVLVFGGSQGEYSGKSFKVTNDLWTFDVARRAWAKVETRNPPPGRGWPQMALSPDADVLLVAGGATGVRDPQAGIATHRDTWALDLNTLQWRELKDPKFPGAGPSNHMTYDPANRVFLFLGRKDLRYGYACGMYALRLSSAATPEPERSPSLATPPYDLTALPEAAGEWTDIAAPLVAQVKGFCVRPSLAARGSELLLAFTEYPEWPGRTTDPVFSARSFRYTKNTWTELVGGDLLHTYPHLSQTPSIGFDADGQPMMALETYKVWGRCGLSVLRFEEGAWRAVGVAGGPEGPKGGGFLPSLAAADTPALAYTYNPGALSAQDVAMLEWRDGQWQPVGPAALNTVEPNVTRAQFPVLLRDARGRLVVAWREHRPDWTGTTATPDRVYVARFEAGKWLPLGPALPVLAPPAGATRPADSSQVRAFCFTMTLLNDEPVVASCEGADGGRTALVVRAWQGGEWKMLGDGALNVLGVGSGAFKPALAADGAALYVAWSEYLANRPPLLFVKQWDGLAWTLVGGPLNAAPGDGSAHDPALAFLAGRPVVAWTELNLPAGALRAIHVRQMK